MKTVGQNEQEMKALKKIIDTMRRFEAVDKSAIIKVYSGRQGCACGCRGKYTYATEHRQFGSKERGYEVTADECNDATVTLLRNKMIRAMQSGDCEVVCDGTHAFGGEICFSIDVGARTYSAYIKA